MRAQWVMASLVDVGYPTGEEDLGASSTLEEGNACSNLVALSRCVCRFRCRH